MDQNTEQKQLLISDSLAQFATGLDATKIPVEVLQRAKLLMLDALGVAHEDGIIADEEMKAPPADVLAEAARRIAAAYPASDVALYLATLTWQDPETWGALASLPEVTGLVSVEG